MDQYSNVATVSWFTRIKESIKSVVIGLVLFLVSFPLLWWNEGRAVQTARSLDEGAGAVVSVAADKIDASNDGKLVHLSGLAQTADVLKDADFGIEQQAIKLTRSVEMYQWVEKKKTEKKKKTGGSEKQKTTYRYEKQWSSSHHDSSDFEHEKGHQNPALAYEERSSVAQNVSVGAFTLPPEMVSAIPGRSALPITEASLAKLTPALEDKTKVSDGAFHVRPSAGSADFDVSQPEVGDHRIRFWVVPAAPVTIVAAQKGSSLGAYQTKAGDPLMIIKAGTVSAAEVFETAQDENRMLTWILRGVGFLMMLIGAALIFRPLVVLADVIPLLGSLLSLGTFLIALAIAIPLSSLTIGIAWVAVRPLIGIPLLVGAVGILVLAIILGRKRLLSKRAKAAPAAPAPAPPP
ncbi:MAG: TMEM43 family protein [Deltaproteobacteria bacterium]|jgi:hypothetical protein|nr:TMEM43 family protein [Deltaproteobacteria bacterium]MBW2533399.1 TMEM43 family protein [Deltaproteobacteria bacterium]